MKYLYIKSRDQLMSIIIGDSSRPAEMIKIESFL